MSADRCACGEPLHYSSARNRQMVQRLVDELGETAVVTTPAGSWAVPRHYIALHGIRAATLPAVAERLGFAATPWP